MLFHLRRRQAGDAVSMRMLLCSERNICIQCIVFVPQVHIKAVRAGSQLVMYVSFADRFGNPSTAGRSDLRVEITGPTGWIII